MIAGLAAAAASPVSRLRAYASIGAVILALAVLAWSHLRAYHHGLDVARGEAAAAIAAAQTAAIQTAGRLALADKQSAADAAARDVAQRALLASLANKGVADAAQKARPVCDLDPVSLGLWRDAVRAANADAAPGAPGGLPVPLRPYP